MSSPACPAATYPVYPDPRMSSAIATPAADQRLANVYRSEAVRFMVAVAEELEDRRVAALAARA